MWRLKGDYLYALLIFGLFSAEVLVLGWLVWEFLRGLLGFIPGTQMQRALVFAIQATGILLVFLAVYILSRYAFSEVAGRVRTQRIESWTQKWVEVILGQQQRPPKPLTSAAREALLNTREVLIGEEADQVRELLEHYGIDDFLLHQLGSRRQAVRLEALEVLAKGRMPTTLPRLIEAMEDDDTVVKLMASRAAARTLGAVRDGAARDLSLTEFASALVRSELPPGVVQESVLLLDDATPGVVEVLLDMDLKRDNLRVCLEVIGRARLTGQAHLLHRFIDHHDPEIRAAALRAVGRFDELVCPAPSVVAAMWDEADFVRIHAAKAGSRLESKDGVPALWRRLSDQSWWVRQAAAGSFMHLGNAGLAALTLAVELHPDKYGRQMALQVLADAGADEYAAVCWGTAA